MTAPPVVRPVGESAILIDFGDMIDDAINGRVIALDIALAADPPMGLIETVPAYASLMLVFDPLVIAGRDLADHALALASRKDAHGSAGRKHVVPICYEPPYAPDLADVAAKLGLTRDQLISAHLAETYRVFMYGFAPGYAYLGGVPPALQLPRKAVAERGHRPGSVIIAGQQCLITTLPMPTGWWVIGYSPIAVFDPQGARPFRFDPGDTIRFQRIDSATLEQQE